MQRDAWTTISPKLLALLVVVLAAVPGLFLFDALRGPPGSDAPGATAGGPGTLAPGSGLPLRISGDVRGLAPGVTKEIVVTFSNPNPVPVFVTELTVAVSGDSTPPGCPAEPNVKLHQSTGISGESPLEVPAASEVTVDSAPRAPRISFLDTSFDQNSCKGVSFRLTYSASART